MQKKQGLSVAPSSWFNTTCQSLTAPGSSKEGKRHEAILNAPSSLVQIGPTTQRQPSACKSRSLGLTALPLPDAKAKAMVQPDRHRAPARALPARITDRA